MFTEKSAAKSILENTKKIYVETHCWNLVDSKNFSHLDLNFYENATLELQSYNFRYVADAENLTVKEGMMDPRCFLRFCLSYDGTIQSAFYQMKPRVWWRILMWLMRSNISKAIDFETEFSDGSFVTTSNAEMASMFDSPPLIFSEFFPAGTPLSVLLERHEARVEQHINTKDVQPLKCHGLKDILESQHRMEKIKAEFRERVGWLKKSEWDRMSGNPNETSDEIYREFTKLRNETPQ